MAKKKINLGTVGPEGDTVSVMAVVDDDTLGAGDRTNFFVTIYREEGEAISLLTVWVMLLGSATVNLYPPFSTAGNARITRLSPRQSNKIPFLIDNAVEGDTIAKYSLICAVQWDEHPPFVLLRVFTVP